MTATSPSPFWILIPSVLAFDVDAGFDALKAAQIMIEKSIHSWEWGTAAEALLELYSNELCVFAPDPFPNGKIPVTAHNSVGLTYARQFIEFDSPTFCEDIAAGDPASLGVFAILLGQSDERYLVAADAQADFLFNQVPRLNNGALSHRIEVPELWADNMTMSFPFLAYQAVQRRDPNLMVETVNQCGLYREKLKSKTNLHWQHIVGEGISQDSGAWSTGNGCAAYGMVRVLHTLQSWSGSSHMMAEANQLKLWIKEILDGAMSSNAEDGLLRNYLDDDESFGEIAGTAILSASAYRMALNDPKMFPRKYITWADTNRQTLAKLERECGVLAPAVNSYDWKDKSQADNGSAEGQAFMVIEVQQGFARNKGS